MSDKPLVYVDGDKIVYRASSFGGCDRALVAARQGYDAKPTPDYALEIFKAGHDAEEWFVNEHDVYAEQAEVEVAVWGDVVVRGHIDGKLGNDGIEIKSQSTAEYDRWTPDFFDSNPLWRKYAWQISAYMHATGQEWNIIRIDRGDFTRWSSYHFEKPPISLLSFRVRARYLEALAGELDIKQAECKGDWVCPFHYLHDEREIVEDPLIVGLVEEWAWIQTREKEIAGLKKELRERIVKALDGRAKIELADGTKVTFSEYEVKEHVVKASKGERLTVTRPKQ